MLIGHWEEVVLVDPFSPPTVCGGCLDFAFQITVDSSAAGGGIFSANLGRFFGYTTDVDRLPIQETSLLIVSAADRLGAESPSSSILPIVLSA